MARVTSTSASRSGAKPATKAVRSPRRSARDGKPERVSTVAVAREPGGNETAAPDRSATGDPGGMPLQAALRAPRICFERIIPDDIDPERHVRRALRGQMMSTGSRTLNPEAVAQRTRMAVVISKKWAPGMTLRCRFLGGTPLMRSKVKRHCKVWEAYAAVKFSFIDDGPAEIRIAFNDNDGSWSAVGRDALNSRYFPTHGPTMNFGWVTDDSDEASDRAVILHEFGHALGCLHEHQSPTFSRNWNRTAVLAYFQGPPNYWTQSEIESNVLDKYSSTGVRATVYDKASIMLYSFSADLFTDGGGATNENTVLSPKDEAMIEKMYPA